jgi:hypothetical protein
MKKHSASKALAFVLVLLMAFGVTASAIDGDPPPTPPASIDITVGQIVDVRRLAEDRGYTWPSVPYTSVQTTSSGAVNCVKHGNDWHVLYGTNVGQGSVTITVAGFEPFTVNFNVTAASNPVTIEVSMGSKDNLSLESMMAERGYTPEDVARHAYWDNFSVNGLVAHVGLLYDRGRTGYPYLFETNGNGRGQSQILYNMADGQVILVNVTIGSPPPKDLWRDIRDVLGTPFIALLTPFGLPFIVVAPLFILYFWIVGFINLGKPAKQHQVTPVLTF